MGRSFSQEKDSNKLQQLPHKGIDGAGKDSECAEVSHGPMQLSSTASVPDDDPQWHIYTSVWLYCKGLLVILSVDTDACVVGGLLIRMLEQGRTI